MQKDTVDKCVQSIVKVKTTRVRSFDTDVPGTFTATGFVVAPGLILSNRHVVSAGPVVAQAALANDEEIPLQPVYRDPVHDFGFFRYDPADVQFFDNIPAIPLSPDGAHVGQEIRVMGNNGGEKLSILSGTMAQLHREAPDYGIGEYNDLNTFYMQAASGTCPGSSGSPVLDLDGRAIALNCGGRSSASYYLPLHRIQRALGLLQQGRPVTRGTLYTEFRHRSFHELRQLGLAASAEHTLRRAGHRGLLVVHATMADAVLEAGDILLEINGIEIADFVQLESLLDDHVQHSVELTVLRHGQRLAGLSMQVHDMFESMPHRFLELGDGLVHDISYQIARSYGIPLNKGVYVSAAGYILGSAYCLRRSIITSLDNQPVATLDDLVSIVRRVPNGSHVPIRYYSLSNRKERIMVLHMDRRWHPMRLATRNDKTGLWDYADLDPVQTDMLPSPPRTPPPNPIQPAGSIDTLKECLVAVDCYAPHVIDGIQNSHSFGAGLVISLDPPRVICDRDAVPIAMCSITLTFQCKVSVPASVVFMHPYYNFVVLAFDRIPDQMYYAQLQDPKAQEPLPQEGDAIHYVGLDGNNQVNHQRGTVSSIKGVRSRESLVPRYRPVNVEVIQLEQDTEGQGGVLAGSDGRVLAFWMNFATGEQETLLGQRRSTYMMGGLPVCYVAPTCLELSSAYALDVEFWTMQLANARQLGLPSSIQMQPHQQRVLYVMSMMDPSSPSAAALRVGDIVLEINRRPVHRLTDLAQFTMHKALQMTIYRDGSLIQCTVPTTRYSAQDLTERVIGWQGLLIQDAHVGAKEQACDKVPEGVYVSCCAHGSPAQATLKAGTWISSINGSLVTTLDMFLQHVEHIKDNYVRVEYITKHNVANVRVLHMDKHYWPTWLVEKDQEHVLGWRLRTASSKGLMLEENAGLLY